MATVHQTYVLMLTQSTDSMLNAIQIYMYICLYNYKRERPFYMWGYDRVYTGIG